MTHIMRGTRMEYGDLSRNVAFPPRLERSGLPSSGYLRVFVYRPHQTPDFFDEPQLILPIPNFATAVEITVERLFCWLMD